MEKVMMRTQLLDSIFNLRFKGPKVWNSISDNLKTLSISNFKESLKYDLVKDY